MCLYSLNTPVSLYKSIDNINGENYDDYRDYINNDIIDKNQDIINTIIVTICLIFYFCIMFKFVLYIS